MADFERHGALFVALRQAHFTVAPGICAGSRIRSTRITSRVIAGARFPPQDASRSLSEPERFPINLNWLIDQKPLKTGRTFLRKRSPGFIEGEL